MKNLRRNVAFSGAGYVLPILVFLVTTPLILGVLGADDYGLYVICLSLIGFMVSMDLGVGQAIIKYVSEYEATGSKAKVKPVLDVALVMYLVLGGSIALLLFVFSGMLGNQLAGDDHDRAALATKALQITALAFSISYVNQFFLNTFKAYHRFDIPSVIHNAANVGGILLATALLLSGYDLLTVLWGHTLMQVLAVSGSFLLIRKVLTNDVTLGLSFDRDIFQEMLSFSAYAFVSNFLGAVVSRLDKLLIGVILGTEFVTYYQIPHAIAQMGNGVVNMVSQVVFPRFSELSGLGESHARLLLYRRASWVLFFVSMLINVILIAAGGAFLEVWMSPELAEKSTLTLQIIALYFFFQSNTVVAYWAIHGAGNAKVTALSSLVGTIAYMIGFYILTNYFSYNGAAMALFLLLTPLPFFYLWVQKNIGHRLSEYLLMTVLFLVVGALLVLLLWQLNAMLPNSIMIILADALALLGMALVLFACYFFKDKLLPEGRLCILGEKINK